MAVSRTEIFRSHIDDIPDPGKLAVPKRRNGIKNGILLPDIFHINVRALVGLHNRPYLQKIEDIRRAFLHIHVHCKFDLNGQIHLLLSDLQQIPDNGCKRKRIVLQDPRKCDDPLAVVIQAVAYHIRFVVVNRCHMAKGRIGKCFTGLQAHQVHSVICGNPVTLFLQVQGIKLFLGITQHRLAGGELHDFFGKGR